jgi:hypothetical protein
MDHLSKPFVHLTIDAVDTVVFDPDGRYDPELYDHYATFVEARDAALSSVELILDEGDYDGDDHREELERMLALLEPAETFEDLSSQPGYHWFVDRLGPARTTAA